jgi:hypothetical protein
MPTNNSWNSQNPAQVAKGGTGLSSTTAYSVLCGGTTTTAALQNVSGVGSAGNVLTSQGAAALPQWAAPASNGSLALISSQTASDSASIAFTTGLTTYNNLLLIITGLITVTDDVELLLQLSNNGGSTYASTGYLSGRTIYIYNSTTWTNNNITNAYNLMGECDDTNSSSGSFWIQDFNSGSRIKISGSGTVMNAGNPYYITSTGELSIAGPDAIKIFASSGHIQSGVFTLYGLVE